MKECWVCGKKIDGDFGKLKWYSDGEEKRVYYLCGLCRNIVYQDMKRDRKHHYKKGVR